MKCIFYLSIIFFIPLHTFAQSKEDKVQMRVIKHLYKKLENYKVNTSDTLCWKFTYSDTSEAVLKNLSHIFNMENLVTETIGRSNENKKYYFITVTEDKIYSPEVLLERVKYLNDVAHYSKLRNHQATIGAVRRARTYKIDNYKPVGKDKKVEKKKNKY